MIELTFQEFHEQLWERWFSCGGHMTWDGKVIYGESPIGTKIENHLPDSLKWKIQLWSLEDCLEFCRDKLPNDSSAMTIRDIEPIMIQKLRPALNVTYNLHPGKDTTPKSKKEIEREKYLDKMYREIFDKKT